MIRHIHAETNGLEVEAIQRLKKENGLTKNKTICSRKKLGKSNETLFGLSSNWYFIDFSFFHTLTYCTLPFLLQPLTLECFSGILEQSIHSLPFSFQNTLQQWGLLQIPTSASQPLQSLLNFNSLPNDDSLPVVD